VNPALYGQSSVASGDPGHVRGVISMTVDRYLAQDEVTVHGNQKPARSRPDQANESGNLPARAVLDKSHNSLASSARRLVIEVTYAL
jgi:hypothetical protein